MKVDRRFRNGLLLTNSYTLQPRRWTTSNENTGIGTPIDFELELGARRTSIAPHNYVSTGVYELPWGPNKRWLNDGTARQDRSAAGS